MTEQFFRKIGFQKWKKMETETETENAYQILKNQLELNEDCKEAYEIAVEKPDEYLETIKEQVEIAISSVKMGQSMIATGEIARCLYNGTHRELSDGTVVELDGKVIMGRPKDRIKKRPRRLW